MFRRGLVCLLACCVTVVSTSRAEDTFFRLPLGELKLIDGDLPEYGQLNGVDWRIRQRVMQTLPDVQLDQTGEAYLHTGDRWATLFSQPRRNDAVTVQLVIRVAAKQDVTGRLVLPKPDGTGLVALKFRIPADSANSGAARDFQFAKIEHYERRQLPGSAGAAWYRYQIEAAHKALGALSQDDRNRLSRISPQRWNGNRTNELDRTYDLFSGGRAVSENLQLDRELIFRAGNEGINKGVSLDSIAGITVKEIDWKPLLHAEKPKLDSLASAIPADQHVVFFPSFAAAMKVADEAKLQGTAALRHTELSSQDTHLVERYEQQLGLSLSVLGRMLGPKFVSSMAITGGDPYFASGTDVAVVFESPQSKLLSGLLLAKIRLDAPKIADTKSVEGTIDGIKYVGLRSPDRRVCSFVAEFGNFVVVTNSLAQVQRLAAVQTGKAATIASLPEFVFFRQRYQLGDGSESALLFISDATIRRWCGPRSRIASSRRVRDAAVLTQVQAASLDFLVTGKGLKLGTITSDLPTSRPVDLQLTTDGVLSPSIGRPDFLTPISELDFDSVTTAERDAYIRWRDGYQRNWTVAFDPIALRIGTDEKRLLADLSIMPLIANSDYREMLQVATGVKLTPESGDPHDTIAHVVIALNRESPPIQQLNRLLAGVMVSSQPAGLGANQLLDPLGWLGQSFAVYADRDPYWESLLKLDTAERARKLRQDGYRLPVAIRIEVAQPLKLALFLTSLRAFIQQAAVGLTKWDTLTHREHPYVKISSARRGAIGTDELDNAAVYYSTVGNGLIFTPNEDLLKRAIDRQLARDQGAPGERGGVSPPTTLPDGRGADAAPLAKKADESKAATDWLGESIGVKFDQVLPMFFLWFAEVADARHAAQTNSWSNLQILNEWKRRYPDHDPVEVHRRFWNVEPVCPGGGRYVWNEQWRTMESTVFGHPGEPKLPEKFEAPLFPFAKVNFGMTFELDGLRSRVELLRETK